MKKLRLLGVTLICVFYTLSWLTPTPAQDESAWLLSQINALRSGNGLHPLAANGILNGTAYRHSVYLANNPLGDFHTEADGSTPRSRMLAAGYNGVYMGENVYGGKFATAQIAYTWWLGSSIHHAGMINVHYTEIGIGVASGSYGRYYTLNFGGGGGAAPRQPVQPPAAQNPSAGVKPAQPTRIPATATRRPTTIPSNTPAPTRPATLTFTPLPTRPLTALPTFESPTATPIPFEAFVPPDPNLTPTPLPAPPVAVAVVITPLPPTQPPPQGAELLGFTGHPPRVSPPADSGDTWRTLIPAVIVLQLVLLGGVLLGRNRSR
jgi:hypothetical protein